VNTGSEMTWIVSDGALNSTPYPTIRNYTVYSHFICGGL